MKSKKQKVVVAMSGGVDSSVAVLLLKEQGYEVIGVFMRFWSPDEDYKLPHCAFENLCCSAEARRVAEKTANKLKIPFHVLDLRDFFKKTVVDYFVKEYLAGRTPNPCIICNQQIKFGALFQKARKIFEADFIATGHYARVSCETKNQKPKTKNYKLLKGKDKNKDQSYFLYTATQNVLRHFLFPIGNYTKEEVRKIAQKNQLPSYKRAESQEICFIPFGNYKDFLKTQVGADKFTPLEISRFKRLMPSRQRRKSGFLTGFKSGKIIDTKGNNLGEHQGLAFYTIGQRRGIRISQKKPLYVVDIKPRGNILVVGEEKYLYKKTLISRNVNWVSGKVLKQGEKVKAKVRYQMSGQEARIYLIRNRPAEGTATAVSGRPVSNGVYPKGKNLKVEFLKPQRAITPGQSVVLYKKNEVLGGGIIDKIL